MRLNKEGWYDAWGENRAWKKNEDFFDRWETVSLIIMSVILAAVIAKIIGII
jgi:hypothetical protein